MHATRILPSKLGPYIRRPHWNGRRLPLALAAAILIHTLLLTAITPAQQLLFPDLVAWERDPDLMHNWVIDTEHEPGNWLLRFSVAIPNIGDGPFEVHENSCDVNSPCAVGTQDIYQHIFDDQGNMFEHFIGNFPEVNTTFGHLSLPALAEYKLRDVVGTNGVGDAVATHAKTSLCVVDSIRYEGPALPRGYLSCGTPSSDGVLHVLGISVGWADLYSIALEHQWIDITGVSDGTYWLEMVVDPNDRVIELDNSNNTERILIDLDVPDGVPYLDLTWRFDASGDWEDGNNWVGGVAPNSREQQAILGDAISVPKTVYTDNPVTVNSVTFDNSQKYALAGVGSVNFEDTSGGSDPSIHVLRGGHEFQTPTNLLHDLIVNTASGTTLVFNNCLNLNGHTLTKSGDGSIEINNGLGTGGGSLIVQQGQVSGRGSVHGDLSNSGGTVSPGNSLSTLPGVTAVVPEPASGALLLLAALAGALHRSAIDLGPVRRSN